MVARVADQETEARGSEVPSSCHKSELGGPEPRLPTPESTSSLPRLHWGGLSLPEIPHHSTRNLKMSVLSKNLEKSRFWRGYLYAYGVKAWFPLSGRD